MKKVLKIIAIILIFILIIITLMSAGIFIYINNKISKIQKVEISKENINIDSNVEENLANYRNIAILGVDSRDLDFGEGNRSDSIIIVSINNTTKEIKLISVYRDTYVDIEGHGLDKITHAYSFGEAPLALSTLNKNFDLNIQEFIAVNFDSVAEMVDLVDGIDINITSEEIKYINSYIIPTAKITGKDANQVTEPGMQTLNGVQAVSYARIRYTEGGDYKRTERMRDVIEAIFTKLKTKSFNEIDSILDQVLGKVYSNITTLSIVSEIPNIFKYKIIESIGWPYEVKAYTTPTWYGVPVTLESNVERLHKEVFGETDYVPSDTVKNISNAIIQKTGYSGT